MKIKSSIIKKISLSSILSNQQFEWLVLLCCQFIFIGFVCSRALVSVGMITLLIASLLYYGPVFSLKKYFQTKELLVLSLYLIIVLLSGLYSEDKTGWLNWVRIKLPFFALPLAFAPLNKLDDKKLVLLFYSFILTFFVSTSLVLGNYFLHFESMTKSFSQGTQIPMPFSHIRYTLMLAFTFFCAIYLLQQKSFLFNKNEKWIQIVYALFAFAALHILSVRSGLLALYIGLLYMALQEVFKRRQVLLGSIAVLCIVIMPFIAIKVVPSLHNKIDYMHYDLDRYKEGDINEHSDAMRLLSMKIGIQIWHESPLIGIGAGDLENESNKIYAQRYPQITEQNRRVPHNQFIWVLATTGLLGFVLFLTAFFFPLLSGFYKYGPILILHLMIFSSFFTEDTFEEQMGSGFYLIFLLILMNHFKRE